jgi:hypothetical protein
MTKTTLTTENLRKILDQFRALRPAPMAITVNAVRAQVLDPRGELVFQATRAGGRWAAECRPGLIKLA